MEKNVTIIIVLVHYVTTMLLIISILALLQSDSVTFAQYV